MNSKDDKKTVYITIAAFLAILIPTPGRFVYGVTIVLEMAILMLAGTFINELIKKMKMEHIKTVILMLLILFISVFYRQMIVLFHPEVALVLGFDLYLPPISLFLMGFLFKDSDTSLINKLKNNAYEVLTVIISGLIFFIIRDVFGYGTFTFFGAHHQIYEKVIFNPENLGIFSFIASIPGALMLLGIFLYLQIIVSQKYSIIKNAEVQK